MDILKKAKERVGQIADRIDALQKERAAIDREFDGLKQEYSKLKIFLETYMWLDNQEERPAAPVVTGQVTGRSREPITPKTLEVIAEAFLKEASPKRTSELVEYLEAKGCEIPSQRKENYVAGVLSRSNKFVARRRHGGWFLKENDPAPEAAREDGEVDGLSETVEAPTGSTIESGAKQCSEKGDSSIDDLL